MVRKIFLIMLFFCSLLILSEILIRCTYNVPFYDFFSRTSESGFGPKGFFAKDEIIISSALGYEYKPHNSFGTNSLGMSDNEKTSIKRPDIYRIIAVGDSVTESSLFPQFIEKFYNEDFSGKRIEVWNCAVAAYCALQECNALQQKWLKFNPDMVIMGFCCNDFDVTPLLTVINGELVGFFPNYANLKADMFLLKHSALYRLITKLFISYRLKTDKADNYNGVFYSLKETKDILEKKGVSFLLVILPKAVSFEENMREEGFRRIKEITNTLQIDTLDLIPLTQQFDFRKLRESPNDDIHFNQEGGRVIAREILKYLKTKLK